jgi:hypothetical protein
VIREDRRNPNLLFVGTDLGAYASLDGGRTWGKLRTGMPTNPVHDLHVHPRDNELILGTHGRGIYIADVSPLQQLTQPVMSADAHLFEIQPTIQWRDAQRPVQATVNYPGQSRPDGVVIHYYLRAPMSGVTVQVLDGARVIAEVAGPGAAGIQTVRWNMQARREMTEVELAAASGRGGRGGRGGGGGGGGGRGGGRGGAGGGSLQFPTAAPNSVMSTVQPGEYRVVLRAGGREMSQTAIILPDAWTR